LGCGNLPGTDIRVPSAVVFPALHFHRSGDFGTALQGELVDFVAPQTHADFAGVLPPGFQYKFLFAPAVAAAPCSGHFRQELNDLACDFHVAML
jgi:hypothetical protein